MKPECACAVTLRAHSSGCFEAFGRGAFGCEVRKRAAKTHNLCALLCSAGTSWFIMHRKAQCALTENFRAHFAAFFKAFLRGTLGFGIRNVRSKLSFRAHAHVLRILLIVGRIFLSAYFSVHCKTFFRRMLDCEIKKARSKFTFLAYSQPLQIRPRRGPGFH